MTNENTDGMSEQDQRYALLCAYVLGEASDAERAEIEAALASSPELRAERARIEGTIGLVQTALVKNEALSPRARDEVLRAALPPVERKWWQESWVRAAAGILFVSFALGGWSIYEARKHVTPECEVAQLGTETSRGGFIGATKGSVTVAAEQRKERANEAPADLAAASTPATSQLEAKVRAEVGLAKKSESNAPGGSTTSTTESADAAAWARVTRDGDDATRRAQDAARQSAPKEEIADLVTYEEEVSKRTADDEQLARKLFKDNAGLPAIAAAEPPQTGTYRGPGDSSASGISSGQKAGEPAVPGAAPTGGVRGQNFAATVAPARAGGGEGEKLKVGASAQPAPAPAVALLSRVQPVGLDGVSGSTPLNGFGYAGDDALGKDAKRDGGDVSLLYMNDAVDHESDTRAPSLSDEDRFILGKLGMQGASASVITPEVRARYRDEYVTDWCGRILTRCRPQPNERPRDMFFRFWGDNAFEFAAVDALSTFSADVDTASYALARRYIDEGHLPAKEQVRTEEFVNYFKADVPAPEKGTFAIRTTLAPSRFGAAAPDEFVARPRDLLRVVVRGKDMPKAERKPLALTFVVDCSGSMKEQNRIEMVKHAMRLLVSQLDARDSIAIVKFSTDAALVLPMTSAKEKSLIESAIYPLAADGSTNSEAGLRMGYGAAVAGLNREATNRVVFLSDGVANVGVTDPNVISDEVKPYREQGIYLNTVGVGMNNHNDVLLEQLADKGDGVCNYVDDEKEAKKVFVDDFMGALETIARDVKIQVEFDPAQVYRYRLLGYENRAVADADFRNDKVDAGEIGAGHQVTALYEIEYARAVTDEAKLDGPRPIATVRVRYKAPRVPGAAPNEEATEIAHTIAGGERTSWEGAGPGYRRATLVAQFAEFLRRSYHARNDSYDQMLADARKLALETPDAEFASLVTLMEKAKALILNGWPGSNDELALAIDKVRENCVLRAQLERVAQERDRAVLAELEVQNRQLEERLRTLLRNRLERPR